MQKPDNAYLGLILAKLIATGDDALSHDQKHQLLVDLQARSPEGAMVVFRELMRRFHGMDEGLKEARDAIGQLRQKMEDLLGKAWYPAIFLGFVGPPTEKSAMVSQGQTRRVVGVCDKAPVETLAKGCEVLLNRELTAIVARTSRSHRPTGQIATVMEKTAHGTLILKSHEEEIEVEIADSLSEVPIGCGDRVRWDSSACMAFDRVEQSDASQFMLGEVPNVSLDTVGGQDENLRKLLGVLSAVLVDPKKAAEYELSGRSSVLLVGRPGTGKTLMVRAVLSEIARMTGRVVRFYVVKPAEWESCLVGNSEKNIREFFSKVRKVTQDGSLAIVYLDEVDCIGRVRGHAQGHYSDQSLTALLAELDGFVGREGVAVIASTNRKDLIDSASCNA